MSYKANNDIENLDTLVKKYISPSPLCKLFLGAASVIHYRR